MISRCCRKKMKFEKVLLKATLVKRYKRFLADATLEDGTKITAHCPNTGSMKTCGSPGDTIYLSHDDNPKRKLKYTWELTETKAGFIGVNTQRPNQIVKEAFENKLIKELATYQEIKAEKKKDESRLDFYLSGSLTGEPPCWVEVKNVTLLAGSDIIFPDSVSERALKHIKTLEKIVESGERAAILFVINRREGKSFRAAHEIHLEYAEALAEAQKKGVLVLIYRVKSSREFICLEPF